MTKHPVIFEWSFWFCMSEFEWRLLSLARSWQCRSFTAQMLPSGHACKTWSEQSSWVLNAQRQLGNSCIPRPVFPDLHSCSASQAPGAEWGGRCPCLWHGSTGGDVQCSGCSSSILDTLCCVRWRFWFFHIQVRAVNVKHPVCMLRRFLCIFNLWNS